MQPNRCDNRPSKTATTPKAPLEFQEREKNASRIYENGEVGVVSWNGGWGKGEDEV